MAVLVTQVFEGTWEKFVQERLGPAVAEVTPDAAEPQIEVQELHNLFRA